MRRRGAGIGSFLKGATRLGKKALSSDIGKAVVAAAKPMIRAAVQQKLAQRGISIPGGGLRLAGQGRRRRAAPRRAVRKQTVFY